jgi:hypothetical protein
MRIRGTREGFLGRLLVVALLVAVFVRPAVATDARHILWTVKGERNTVYLLGSVHLLKVADNDLPAEMLQAYADSTALVMELDPGSIGSAMCRAAATSGVSRAAHGNADAFRNARHRVQCATDSKIISSPIMNPVPHLPTLPAASPDARARTGDVMSRWGTALASMGPIPGFIRSAH